MPHLKAAREHAAKTAVKEKRARDAALATQEYEAERLASLAKTARLRALRLAKEPEAVLPVKKAPKKAAVKVVKQV